MNAALHRDHARSAAGRNQSQNRTGNHIHTTVMKVPSSFVHAIFLHYSKGSGYSAGKEGPTAALNCVLRSGHTAEEKTDLLKQLWSMFQGVSAVATDQLVISLQEISASNAMEMGQIMPEIGHE